MIAYFEQNNPLRQGALAPVAVSDMYEPLSAGCEACDDDAASQSTMDDGRERSSPHVEAVTIAGLVLCVPALMLSLMWAAFAGFAWHMKIDTAADVDGPYWSRALMYCFVSWAFNAAVSLTVLYLTITLRASCPRRVAVYPPLFAGLTFFSIMFLGIHVELQSLNIVLRGSPVRESAEYILDGAAAASPFVAPTALFSVVANCLSCLWLMAACCITEE